MSVVASPARPEHLVLQGVAGVSSHVDGLLDDPVWSLSDGDLLDALEGMSAELARLAAARLALIGEAHGRQLAGRLGASSTAVLLRERLRMHPGEAGQLVTLAADLDGPRNATGTALRAGSISVQQAWVIVKAIRSLPRTTPVEKVSEAETYLVEMARTFDPLHLGKLGDHLRQQLTIIDTSPGPDPEPSPAGEGSPDGGPDGDADGDGPDGGGGGGSGDDQQSGSAEEPDPADQRWLSLTALPGGLTRISGELDAEAADLLRSALDPISGPRPAADGIPDPRSPQQRRGDALVELLHLVLADGDLPTNGGIRPHMTVTVPLSTLTGAGTTPATTGWGLPLSAAVLRRLRCDATLTRVVLNADSVPINVGRASRTAPPALRKALAVRDGGCIFPGCNRPPAWCEAHHVITWPDDGPTDLDNSVLLCGYHHRVVHHHGWAVRFGADRKPELIPPAWVDPEQRPRRNPYSNHIHDLLRRAPCG